MASTALMVPSPLPPPTTAASIQIRLRGELADEWCGDGRGSRDLVCWKRVFGPSLPPTAGSIRWETEGDEGGATRCPDLDRGEGGRTLDLARGEGREEGAEHGDLGARWIRSEERRVGKECRN